MVRVVTREFSSQLDLLLGSNLGMISTARFKVASPIIILRFLSMLICAAARSSLAISSRLERRSKES